MRLSKRVDRSDASFSSQSPRIGGKNESRARHSVGVRTHWKRLGADLGLVYASATHGTSSETSRFTGAALFGTTHASLCQTEERFMKLVRRIVMRTALSLAGLATSFAQHAQADFDRRADFFQYKTVLASAGLLALAAAIVLRVAAQKMV
jgi:hypothetical protein